MSFVKAVQNTPEIAACFKPGLQALGSNSRKMNVRDTRALEGSVNIDECLEKRYPNAPRWDYVFGYKERVYYVEVHTAGSVGEVKHVIEKFKWLKQWRKDSAPNLEDLEDRSTYHWVSSGDTARYLKRGRYGKELNQAGIKVDGAVLHVDKVSAT